MSGSGISKSVWMRCETNHAVTLSSGASWIVWRKTATHCHFGFWDALDFILDFVISFPFALFDGCAHSRICLVFVSLSLCPGACDRLLWLSVACTDFIKMQQWHRIEMPKNWLIACDFHWSNHIRSNFHQHGSWARYPESKVPLVCCVFFSRCSFVCLSIISEKSHYIHFE